MSAALKYSDLQAGTRGLNPVARSAAVLGRSLRSRKVLIFALELLWLAASGAALVKLSQILTETPPDRSLPLSQLGVLVFIYLLAFYLMNLYDLDAVATQHALVMNLVQALGLSCVVIGLLEQCFVGWSLPLKLMLLHAGLTASFVIAARAAAIRLADSRWPLLSIGFIGSRRAYAELKKEENVLRRLGFQANLVGESLWQARRKLREQTYGFHRLIIDEACLGQMGASDCLQGFGHARIKMEKLSSFRERTFAKLDPGPHLVDRLALGDDCSLARLSRMLRRARDVILAGTGVLLTLPLTLIIAIAIKCDSPGPVFFMQDRVGKNGVCFKMFKFRSMYQASKPASDPEWTTSKCDARITRVGAVIRGFHLDELPQLINVLRGDMSLVGPRPFHPLHSAQLEDISGFKLRLSVLPGITGWAQVRCNYADSVEHCEEVLARDLYYVKHAGILFDLMIMIETMRICLWRRGAR
jgi:lipopolysaccharide/colanic/teichoic acid biosynthesis glycosyltransferase